MVALYRQLRSLLQGDIPVLLVGETGVGKEHLVRILHASSVRRSGPLVAVNCAAIPPDLLEAEMFGVRAGAATGVKERPGRFQEARGGTLLLDEIGDMPAELQAKLLRALQEKEVHPLVYHCADGQAIDSGMLSASILFPAKPADAEADESADLETRLQVLERRLILEALAKTGGNQLNRFWRLCSTG